MMTILTSSSWTTFLDCVGSMKTSWLLPHTPLWVSHSSAHLHKSIDTTMDGKLQAWLLPHTPLWVSHFSSCSTWTCTLQTWWRSPLDVILSMGCMISSSWHKPMDTYLTPHRLSHRTWVSTQSAMDNAYHTMGSLDPSRYIFYALWVDQLDSLLT